MTKNGNVLTPLREAHSTYFTLAKEAAMVSIPKIIGVISLSVVLGLSLSNAAQATGSISHGPCVDRKGGLPILMECNKKMSQGIETGKSDMHSSAMQATEGIKHDPCVDRKGGLPNLVECNKKMPQGIETGKSDMHSSAMQATGGIRHDPCVDRKGGLPNLVECNEKMR